MSYENKQILSRGLIKSYENKQISFVNKFSPAVKLHDMKIKLI